MAGIKKPQVSHYLRRNSLKPESLNLFSSYYKYGAVNGTERKDVLR